MALSTRLDAFEFEIARRLGTRTGERWLVAVSGGLDSMALLETLLAIRSRLGIAIAVANVHHGPASSDAQSEARARARELAGRRAQEAGLPFFALGWAESRPWCAPSGAGESELREFRLSRLEACRAENGFDRVALAHHRDDLLETRLIRLIRGTGPEGLLAMTPESATLVRPFLESPRAAVAAYAGRKGVVWADDPSNDGLEPLRNWLRHGWLPALEAKRPGATECCARSLELIAAALVAGRAQASPAIDASWSENGIDRLIFDTLSEADRRTVLALYLRRLGARGLGRSHLREIAKRLDTEQKSPTFQVGGWVWKINAGQIQAGPLPGSRRRSGIDSEKV